VPVGHLREALLGGLRIPTPIAVCRLRRQRCSAVLQVTATPVGRESLGAAGSGHGLGGSTQAGPGRRVAAAAATEEAPDRVLSGVVHIGKLGALL
jgi:hypothetical protein